MQLDRRRFLRAAAASAAAVSLTAAPSAAKREEARMRQHHERARDIPMRALIAKDVAGLLLAGRCISGDFIAHSSYRVTGNAVPMGEAAGVAAALAAKSGRLPQDVPWAEIDKARSGTSPT